MDVRAEAEYGTKATWDGQAQGNLVFRGHWVASACFRWPETCVGDDSWFPTGDVGRMDPDQFVC